MENEVTQAIFCAGAVVFSGIVAAVTAIASSILTARQMKGVTERQIEAATGAERSVFLRGLRSALVTELRNQIQALRDAIADHSKVLEINAGMNSVVLEQLIREKAAQAGEPVTSELVNGIRARIAARLLEDEGVGVPSLASLRILGRMQVHIPSSGGMRNALRDLQERWSQPMVAAGAPDFGRESLVRLMIHADAIERSIDEFVVAGA